MTVTGAGNATIRGLTITGGSSTQGGGICNLGTLVLIASTVENNASGFGGGIFNSGTLTLLDSTVANNTTFPVPSFFENFGAGIANFAGTLTLLDSTIADNHAASAAGGGVGFNSNFGGTVAIQNTIIADNTAAYGDPDVLGAFTSLGNNLIGNTTGGSGFVASDLLNVDPELGLLALNGGPTPTFALLPGSPAIDHGNDSTAATVNLPGLVGMWKGDGNANDSVGGDNGTAYGVAYTAGVVNQAFQFNGINSLIVAHSTPALNSSNFTIGGWFNLAAAPGAGSEFILASKYGGNYDGWILRIGSNLLPGVSVDASATSNVSLYASAPISLNAWYYISATYNGSTVDLYVDGTLAGSTTLAGGYTPSATALSLGAAIWLNGDFTDGSIDEFSFYSRALSSNEIQALYASNGEPAVSAGTYVTTDGRGFARVYNGTVDIGAFESQPYVVTNAADSGPGSLRQAIIDDVGGSEPITFSPALDGQTITLSSGPIEIGQDLTIIGPGADLLNVSGDGNSGVFVIDAGADVAISGLSVSQGVAAAGGGIDNRGTLTVDDSVFSEDQAQAPASFGGIGLTTEGGAIANEPGGNLTVTRSTFANDSAIGGDGIPGLAGSGTGGNGYGGAIFNADSATLSISDDTFTSDLARGGMGDDGGGLLGGPGLGGGGYGGAIANWGAALVISTTIAGNSVTAGAGNGGQSGLPTDGAGIFNGAGSSLEVVDTIAANNTGGHDIANLGTIAGSNDLVMTGKNLASGMVSVTADPELGPLRDNGGTTPTLALLPGSPAIDAGNNNPTFSGWNVPPTDQRGFARIANGTIDIGAFESQPYLVTNTDDSGPGSLREAIVDDADSRPVTFAPALVGMTITLSSPLVIQSDLTIDGSAAPGLIVSGGGITGVITVARSAQVTLRDLSVENGNNVKGGPGGIFNGGTLTLDSVTVAHNRTSDSGGGIENLGTLTIIDSTIADNTATSAFGGGGIASLGKLTLLDSTISGNLAFTGGGLYVTDGTTTLRDTIVAGNRVTVADPDIVGAVNSLGHNLVGYTNGDVTGLVASDLTGVDPVLGPLAANGGPTFTLALLPGSPAIDGGDATGAPSFDQRGLPRIVNGAIDIGAYELQVHAPVANAGGAYVLDPGQPLTLNASQSSDADNLPLTYTWDLNGDGVFGDATGVSPTVSWAQLQALGITPGRYQVRVVANDGYGGTHAVVSPPVTLTVLPIQPTSIAPASPGPRNTPLDSVDVTFTFPIDPATLNPSDVSLTRGGVRNLIDIPFQVLAVPNTTGTYEISGLAGLTTAQGTYVLAINGAGVADQFGDLATGTASITWLMDTTPPLSHVVALPTRESSLAFTVRATGTDPASPPGVPVSGIVSYDLYVSVNNGPFSYWTKVPASNPTATFQGQSSAIYAFVSLAHDAAGNVETKPINPLNQSMYPDTATFVPDLTAPVTKVTSATLVAGSTVPTLLVAFSGTETGGSGLSSISISVSVDGGASSLLGTFAAGGPVGGVYSGSLTYEPIADGKTHTYAFTSLGTNGNGIAESKSAADLTLTAAYSAPPALKATGLTVQHGAVERSFVRYVDIDFNETDAQAGGLLSSIIASLSTASPDIQLIHYAYGTTPGASGAAGAVVPLSAAMLRVVDHAIEIDFGQYGLGGVSSAGLSLNQYWTEESQGDGYYEIALNLTGKTSDEYFDRLLGDIDGDGTVSAADVSAVQAAEMKNLIGIGAAAFDVDGSGAVNSVDLFLVTKSKGRKISGGVTLSG